MVRELSARPAVTLPVVQYHRPLANSKLNCLITEAHVCEQHAQMLQECKVTGSQTRNLLIASPILLPLYHHANIFTPIKLFVTSNKSPIHITHTPGLCLTMRLIHTVGYAISQRSS